MDRVSKQTGEDETLDAHPLADVMKTHPASIKRSKAMEAQLDLAHLISRDCACPGYDHIEDVSMAWWRRLEPRARKQLIRLEKLEEVYENGYSFADHPRRPARSAT